jgi:hypothetical protein
MHKKINNNIQNQKTLKNKNTILLCELLVINKIYNIDKNG